MALLLDTHALLLWLAGDQLAPRAAEQISDPSTLVAVTAASVWEIAIKRTIGKVEFEGSIAAQAGHAGFELLAISSAHAERAGALPLHHRDPFDRMLIAQAQAENLTIVTRDREFDRYEVALLHC